MTDFYSVLQRAVATLPDGSGPQRRQVYEKARKALLKQLQSFDPPLPSADVTTQRLALEDAIRKIENEIARQNRARRAVAGALPAGAATAQIGTAAGATATATAVTVPRESEAELQARRRAEAERARAERLEMLNDAVSDATLAAPEPAALPALVAPGTDAVDHDGPSFGEDAADLPAGVPARRRPGRPEPQFAEREADDVEFEEVSEAADGDEAVVDAEAEEPAEDPAARKRRQRQEERASRLERRAGRRRSAVTDGAAPAARRGTARSLAARAVVTVAAVGLLVGASYAAYTQRERLMAALSPVGSEAAPRDPIAANSPPGLRKNEDRLAIDGEETRTVATTQVRVGGADAAGASADADLSADRAVDLSGAGDGGAGAEGTGAGEMGIDDVAADDVGVDVAGAGGDASRGEAPTAQQFAAVAPEADAAAVADDAAQAAAPTGGGIEQAALIEEGARPGEKGTKLAGTVSWAMAREAMGGAEPESLVRATSAIPERMTVTITMRENTDSSLPASHLIEVQFTTQDGFDGGGIKNVPGLIMKQSEESRGDALRGAAARVSAGLFWIALSEDVNDRTKNLELLQDRDWIDVPILYENGRRAILTLSKGGDGVRSVNDAIANWNS